MEKPILSGRQSDSENVSLLQEEVSVCPPQQGYCVSWLKSLLFYPLAIFPVCLGLLVAYWFPHVWIRITCWRCSLDHADYVVVKDLDGKHRVETVKSFELEGRGESSEDEEGHESSEDDALLQSNATVKVILGHVVKWFEHRHLRYLYDSKRRKFVLLRALDRYTCDSIHALSGGLIIEEHRERLLSFGSNSIKVPVKPYHVLFVEEVLHPFYIFQLLAIAFWMIDQYYYYSFAVFFISTLSIVISLVQTRRHMQQLRDMVTSSCTVNLLRNGRESKDIASESLVPGDVLIVPPTGMVMPCDAALLTGHAIVNEAMLTGESVPVTKTPLPHSKDLYRPEDYKRHTLFGGTHVIQTRFYGNACVLAVVVRTGFATSKGGMVRSILFPKPLNVKFYSDAMKFVLVLAVLAFFGFIYTLSINFAHHYEVKETILRAFDVITIVVPPALPAALTVGTVYALNRLRKQQIFCISPQRVTLCGKIKLVCFDKTGTLTEDSLDLYGVKPASEGSFSSPLHSDPSLLPAGHLLYGMATCHSLTSINGKLSGDPLDLKMFLATKWIHEEPSEDHSRFDTIVPTVVRPPTTLPGGESEVELGILRQFTFSSDLQRMSVLVRSLPTSDPRLLNVYTKGAPEKIRKLCKPETVPPDFFETLSLLTQRGYRVLAMAHRTIHMPWHKAERIQRDVVECDLTFVGLLVMQNRLKPETAPVITTLMKADIRTLMVTGDNMLTAVSVARECGMIGTGHRAIMIRAHLTPTLFPVITYHLLGEGVDQSQLLVSQSSGYGSPGLAELESRSNTPLLSYQEKECLEMERAFHLVVDGQSFGIIRSHCKDLFERLLVKGTVFARMSPNQKAQLVTALMDIGYGVSMCGDGANDCGALKTAHAGISLSETEASVASPFTSKVPNITCVPKVIMEGRAALVTSFSVFKFMALYSLAEFISAAILYAYESNLGDLQYLYIDLILILFFAFVMGFTGPYPHLVKRRPPGTLAGIHVLLSVGVQMVLLVLFQVGALLYLQTQSWYVPLVPQKTSTNIVCSENTVIFQISIFQYLTLAIALSTAAPYRRPVFTNYWFMLCLMVLLPANLYLALAPASWWPWFWRQLQLVPSPSLLFRVTLVEFALLNFIIAYFIEGYIISTDWMRKVLRVLRCKRKLKNRYKHILMGIEQEWPPCEIEGGVQ